MDSTEYVFFKVLSLFVWCKLCFKLRLINFKSNRVILPDVTNVFHFCSLHSALPWPGKVLQMIVTNLRNRPLESTSIMSTRESILSLYHNLITGSKEFPVIPFIGSFHCLQTAAPFAHTEPEQRENTASRLLEEPAGIMVHAAGSGSTIFTPVLPEKTEPGAVKADRRNCVRRMECNGRTVTRVLLSTHRDGKPLESDRLQSRRTGSHVGPLSPYNRVCTDCQEEEEHWGREQQQQPVSIKETPQSLTRCFICQFWTFRPEMMPVTDKQQKRLFLQLRASLSIWQG